VGQTIKQQGVETWISENDLQGAARRRIPFEYRLQIFFQQLKQWTNLAGIVVARHPGLIYAMSNIPE
jgi:hypothetical protein